MIIGDIGTGNTSILATMIAYGMQKQIKGASVNRVGAKLVGRIVLNASQRLGTCCPANAASETWGHAALPFQLAFRRHCAICGCARMAHPLKKPLANVGAFGYTIYHMAETEDYIIWDWNGTLLNDVKAAVNALNRMLAARGVPPTTLEYYRAHFGFPVRPFYAELGVDLEHEDWDLICTDFHRFIAEEPDQSLRPDAAATLERASSLGFRQCILSALREDKLLRSVADFGIARYFDAVFGVDNLDGATKLSRAHELRAFIASRSPSYRCFFIGDTLHDAEVAAALGFQCILVDGGHQTSERLSATGHPVAGSLAQALDLIES